MTTPQPLSSLLDFALFDLDGTLIDSAPDLYRAAIAMTTQIQLPARSLDQVRSWIGDGVSRLVERVISGSVHGQVDPQLAATGERLFREAYAQAPCVDSSLYPGALETLDHLVEMGIHLGLVTNKAECFTWPILEQLKIERYFDVVVGGDTLPTRKPDSGPLLHAMSKIGVGNRGVLIGDSETDIRAAQAAGMPIVAVSYGYNRGRDIGLLGPDVVVHTLLDLPDVLTHLASRHWTT